MNTVPDTTVHIESRKASEGPEGTGLTLTVTQKCVLSNIIKYRTCFLVIPQVSTAKAVAAIVHYYILNRAPMLGHINGNGYE